jgi:hypothetical protein
MTNTNTQADADFLDLDIDTVSNLDEATSLSGKVDPTRWKPSVSKRNPSYSAIIRLLPQGIEGVKNKTYPSVKVLYHHLKLNGVHMEVKCCRNNGGDCPICRAVWDRYNELAKTYEKGSSQLKVWTSMTARPEWHTNILVREDDNKSANNGKVLVWRHSDAVERTLRAPFDDSVESEIQNANGAPAKGALAKMKKERRKFIPHSPTKGVDFGVIVSWDAAKNMTSYDGSDYVAESTPLADTKEEMLEILNKCHDLTKYLADVPDEATAAAKWREFLEKASSAQSAGSEGGFQANGASFGAPQNPNYANRPTTKVAGADFLGNSAAMDPAPAKEPDEDELLVSGATAAPVKEAPAANSAFAARRAAAQAANAAAMANQLPEGDDDDSELPF